MFPRLVLIAFSIAQPFLIQAAIDFVEGGTKSDRYGYGLIGAFGISFLGIAVRLHSLPCSTVPTNDSNIWFRFRQRGTNISLREH